MKMAFYKAKKHFFNRAVAWWTDGPYSHVEVVLTDVVDMPGYFLCGSSSHKDGGVRLKIMQLPADTWNVVELNATETETEAAARWFSDHAGQRYDSLGLFGFITRRGTQDQDKWFCSEACAASIGMKDPWRFDPNTLRAALALRAAITMKLG